MSERSDAEAFRRAARELLTRVLNFVGTDDADALGRTIEAVRVLADSGYTIGDSQVDQQLVAGSNADDRIRELLPLVDQWDRAVLLRHVSRLLLAAGDITKDGADFLEGIGELLELEASDVEYVVVSELSGER